MSMENLLYQLLPGNEHPLSDVTVIRLSNGETVSVEKDPVHNGDTWRWGIDGTLFNRDNLAENYLRQYIQEKVSRVRVLMRPRYEVPHICGTTCPHLEHDLAICDNCPVEDDAKAKQDGVRLVYAVMSKKELAGIQKKALRCILKAIEDCHFSIYVDEENGKERGLEFENWTPNGVDMPHYIYFEASENPYDPNVLLERIQNMVSGFDPDEEIRCHMEDPNFRSVFSYRKAVEEFEGWQQALQELFQSALAAGNAVLKTCRDVVFESNLSYREILEENE